MNYYKLGTEKIDSIELKAMVVSRGLKVNKKVYCQFSEQYRLNISPLTCNCILLSDGTIVQMTDVGFHLQYLGGMLSLDNLKLLRYASLGTPFTLDIVEEKPALMYQGELIDFVTFPPKTNFYKQKTTSGLSFAGNCVLQGLDWVAFQCLWPCEFAAAKKPCQFCFSGAEFESIALKGKTQPGVVSAADVVEIIQYAIKNTSCNSVQITGGSTFSGKKEEQYIRAYLTEILHKIGKEQLSGEILLYITPPEDLSLIDEYFNLGADRIACSLEVWDKERAAIITPGKISFTTRERHLKALNYTVEKHGIGSAFTNFIIGLESYEALKEGATYLAERGIIPTASIWMPMGRPVMGSMQAPEIKYFRKVKELFAELYCKYKLEPAGLCGLNVCMERDIWRYSQS